MPPMPDKVSSICSECGAPISFVLGTSQVRCSHCDAGLVVEQGARLVRLGCPRCSGNFYYIDGSMCGHCPYCDTPLLALAEDRVLRYVVRPQVEAPAGGAQLTLLPFWHLGGLLYLWHIGSRVEVEQDTSTDANAYDGRGGEPVSVTIRRDSGPRKAWGGRVLDLSLPDPATLALGVTSLRLRAAVFPLEPFASEHEQLGRVVPPTLEVAAAREQLLARAMQHGTQEGLTRVDCQRSDVTSDSLSLYYYPFWVLRDPARPTRPSVWDAVCGEQEPLAATTTAPATSATALFDELQLVELTCGECGGPLPAGNHSAVLFCRACGRFWQVSRRGLEPFVAHFARPAKPGSGTPVWLPFWRVQCKVRYFGKQAARVADLNNVLGVIPARGNAARAEPDAPLCYFTPAFGALRAPRVDHAARDLTRYQPALTATEPGAGEIYNCFFNEQDARQLGYVTWILLVPAALPHRLRSIRVETTATELWYVPFDQDPGGRELVNLVTDVRHERAAFRGVRH